MKIKATFVTSPSSTENKTEDKDGNVSKTTVSRSGGTLDVTAVVEDLKMGDVLALIRALNENPLQKLNLIVGVDRADIN